MFAGAILFDGFFIVLTTFFKEFIIYFGTLAFFSSPAGVGLLMFCLYVIVFLVAVYGLDEAVFLDLL